MYMGAHAADPILCAVLSTATAEYVPRMDASDCLPILVIDPGNPNGIFWESPG